MNHYYTLFSRQLFLLGHYKSNHSQYQNLAFQYPIATSNSINPLNYSCFRISSNNLQTKLKKATCDGNFVENWLNIHFTANILAGKKAISCRARLLKKTNKSGHFLRAYFVSSQ